MQVILLIYLLAALGIFILPRWLKEKKAIPLALIQLAFFVFFLSKIKGVKNGDSINTLIHWIPQIGLSLEFSLNGLSLAFALLVTGIGTLVFLYASAYMKSYEGTDKFYFYLFLFSGAMLGLVLSGNLIQLFIFWELTSFLSYLLISFFHEKDTSRKAAFQSLIVTGLGGLFLLAGIILLGSIVDSYSIKDWIEQSEIIKTNSLYLPGLLLILIGAFTKSAQFPFHFWLPDAMQAPTPVSAYLHSATMVKAGVFLLVSLSPALGGTIAWTYIIPLIGVITMLIGSYFAITQTDLKAILAYTTICALGILVLLIGIDTELSIKAALLFLFVHAFYKASLFMIAGLIDKKTGTRELVKLGELVKYMPVTFVIASLSLLSMAGLPPMLGFLGKELIYEAKIQSPGIASLVLVLGVAANVLMIAVSLYFLYEVFLGKKVAYSKQPNEKGLPLLFGAGILTLLSLFFGLFPSILGKSIIDPALKIIQINSLDVILKIWHGFNQVFYLSLFTIFLGICLFVIVIKQKDFLEKWRSINNRLFVIKFTEIFSSGLSYFIDFSKLNTKRLQHGYHRYYILSVIAFTSLLLWMQIYVTRNWEFDTAFTLNPFYISGLVLIITLSTIYSMVAKTRIVMIIAMGVTGYGISLIYLFYSAVDLAITQILIETLTVIMFVLILQRLPLFAKLSSRHTKLRDLAIAIFFGSAMTMLALQAIHVDFSHIVSDFFVENSYIKAHGKNIVNVILVDFRAFDTLGEITVLSIAGIGVYVLLKSKIKK